MDKTQETYMVMYAYPDSKCCYGYMTICNNCKENAPHWVDISNPIINPPAEGKKQRCELCNRKFILSGANN